MLYNLTFAYEVTVLEDLRSEKSLSGGLAMRCASELTWMTFEQSR